MPSSPFGPRLRALRQSRGLTLPALAIAAGITKGYLSKIEHSAQPPTFSTLQALAAALGADVGELLQPREGGSSSANIEIHKPDEADWQAAEKLGGYHFLPLLRSYRNKYLSPFLMRVPRGTTAYFRHDGEEFLYVVKGEIEIEYERRRHALKAGGSAYLDSRRRHRFHNRGGTPAMLLAVNFVYRRF